MQGPIKAPTPQQLRFRALVAAIETNPDDEAAWAVYGDALQEKSDVRGELIARRADPAAVVAFATVNARALFADAAPLIALGETEAPIALQWHMGSVDGVTVEMRRANRKATLAALRTLLAQPVTNFIRKLAVSFRGLDDADAYEVVGMLRPEQTPRLRALVLEAVSDDADRWPYAFDVHPATIPRRIERASITGRFSSRRLRLPETLRYLCLRNDNFLPEDYRLSDAPALEHVVFSMVSKGSYAQNEELELMCRADGLPKLRTLEIHGCRFLDMLLPALAGSRLLAQLTTLDLQQCTLHVDDIRFILEHAASFGHLEQLRVPAENVAALAAAGLRC